ncbi:MAG: hypothetical protein ACE5EX_02075 [Phycisphaerae bacterium]
MARRIVVAAVAAIALCAGVSHGQLPDHPIITEVYTDPPGINDGPIGRDPTNLHQSFIEIYLPTCAELNPALGLNCDAMNLTFYDVEGDSSSSGVELVNYRLDLPPFDVDLSTPPAAGVVARPSSGIVVLGWVDYLGTSTADLAGTPSTRVALINGGITATPAAPNDYVFVAINGHHSPTGTTNFPILSAENLIDLPAEATSGIVQNGSEAYLLVNRDSAGYVELCDDKHAASCAAGAAPLLPNDTMGLKTSALLDGFASNDHSKFRTILQPYATPTGKNIDLETVLPLGGAFSLLVPQIPETDNRGPVPGVANGYARVMIDVAKTTENATPFDDNPVTDALNAYRPVRNNGPFFPSPGRAASITSAPELAVALAPEQVFEILPGTNGGPGVLCANVGGGFGIDMTASPGASSNPAVATFAAGAPATAVTGPGFGFPGTVVTLGPSAVAGATASVPVTVTATNTIGTDPAVVAPVQMTTMTVTVINPTTGVNELGAPFQATVFAAVQGVPAQAGVLNAFLLTDLGAFAATNLGFAIQDGRGHGAMLADPTTDLNNGTFVQIALVEDLPDPAFPLTFINASAPPVAGKLDLVQTVVQSAEQATGLGTYDDAINPTVTGLRARKLNHPDTLTFGGTFTPSETLHFVEPTGKVADPRSGLSNVTTTRTFELAILDANVRSNNTIESGTTDDYGIIVEVLDVEPTATVVPGEYVFLSYSGGIQGADIDSLDVPGGPNIITITYLDLDNLHDVLGIISIEQIFIVDGSGGGEIEEIEVYSLNPIFIPDCLNDTHCDDGDPCTTDTCNVIAGTCANVTKLDGSSCADGLFCNGDETCLAGVCQAGTSPCPTGPCDQCDELTDTCRHCIFDVDMSDTIGTGDFGSFSSCFNQTHVPADPQYNACLPANFDGVIDGATGAYTIGTSDFGPFSGCFNSPCGTCSACYP